MAKMQNKCQMLCSNYNELLKEYNELRDWIDALEYVGLMILEQGDADEYRAITPRPTTRESTS